MDRARARLPNRQLPPLAEVEATRSRDPRCCCSLWRLWCATNLTVVRVWAAALALAQMRLVTPLLLVGVCSTPCSAQIPQAVANLANVKNLGIGSAFTGFLTALSCPA